MASIEHDLFIGEWQATPTKVMLVLKDYNYSSQADRHRPLDRFNLKDREAGYRTRTRTYCCSISTKVWNEHQAYHGALNIYLDIKQK